jgi:hypothetical protein
MLHQTSTYPSHSRSYRLSLMKPCTKRPSLDLTVNSMTEPNAGKLQVDNQWIIPTLLSDTGPFHAIIALTIF